MIFVIAILALLFTAHLLCKTAIRKKLKSEYERSLVNANRDKALQLGRIYYQSLTNHEKKAKGIISIDKKIVEDFRAFNVNLC